MNVDKIAQLSQSLKSGELILLTHQVNGQCCGIVAGAAEYCNEETINFMIRQAKGQVSLPLTQKRAAELELSPVSTASFFTTTPVNYTVSVDFLPGTTTGISAEDRAATAMAVANPSSRPQDFRRPGHIFPIVTHPDGVLGRESVYEAAVDLVQIAGLYPVAVTCEILNSEGQLASFPEVTSWAQDWGLPVVSVEEVVNFRLVKESRVEKMISTPINTPNGDFLAHGFVNTLTHVEHLAITRGFFSNHTSPLVSIHFECMTSHLGLSECSCRQGYEMALEQLRQEKAGMVLFLRMPTESHQLLFQLQGYVQQELGMKSHLDQCQNVSRHMREMFDAAHILKCFNLKSIRLATDNPEQRGILESCGIAVSNQSGQFTRSSKSRAINPKDFLLSN